MDTGIAYYGCMATAIAVALWARSRWKAGRGWGYMLTVVSGIVALVFAGLAIQYQVTRGSRSTEYLLDREAIYRDAAFVTLGEHLRATYPGKRLVVLAAAGRADATQVIIDSLKIGLDGVLTPIVVQVGTGAAKAEPGAARSYTVDHWEAALAAEVPGYRQLTNRIYAEATTPGDPQETVVLSLLGLPPDPDESLTLWDRAPADRPIVILANARLYGMRPRIRAGTITAILAANPAADHSADAPVPPTTQAQFDERWLLIDDLNVEELAAQHPTIFGPD